MTEINGKQATNYMFVNILMFVYIDDCKYIDIVMGGDQLWGESTCLDTIDNEGQRDMNTSIEEAVYR